MENERLNLLKLRQIGFADLVVLNKVDLVGPEHIEVIKEWIDHHIQRIRIIEATHCDVPLEALLAVGRFDPARAIEQREGSRDAVEARDAFETWSYETDRPLSLDVLREMVRRELPASVYRCKGIILSAEEPRKRFALQAVGRRTEITDLGPWEERVPGSRIVAIGHSIDKQALTELFQACTRPHA